MRRFVGPAFPVLLLLLGVPVGPAAAHDGHSHTIEGRFEPELLPETSVWDHVFFALHDVTGGSTDPGDAEVRSFVPGNLFISEADTAILLQEVAAARSRIQGAQQRLDNATRAGNRPDDEAALRKQMEKAILDSRDQTLQRLSPRGRKALVRWVAVIKYGMTHGPNR